MEHFDTTKSTKRIYDGEITEVLAADPPGDDTSYTYSAASVNTMDRVVVSGATPANRVFSSDLADRPQIVPCEVGDPCELWVNLGEVKLFVKTEKYIVGECAPTVPPPGIPV